MKIKGGAKIQNFPNVGILVLKKMFREMGNVIDSNYDASYNNSNGNMFIYFDSDDGARNLLAYGKIV